MQYRVFDIGHDSDSVTVDLPKEFILELEDEADPTPEPADAISDKIGCCLNGFKFEAASPDAAPRIQLRSGEGGGCRPTSTRAAGTVFGSCAVPAGRHGRG